MELFILFLIIAATLLATTDLVLASAESEGTRPFEFDSVQRYLRANSTSEQEDEERKFTNEEILTGIETFLPKLPGFTYDSIKEVARLYLQMMELEVLMMEPPPPNKNTFIIRSFFTNKLLEEICRGTSLDFEKYIDIALYLVLLEKVGRSTRDAAKEIDNGMKSESTAVIASRMEDGQFHLWSHILETDDRVKKDIFKSRSDMLWINKVLERFRDFLANKDKRDLPGMT